MEFCEAGDLFTLITNQRGKPLQEELIFFFFLQVPLPLPLNKILTAGLFRLSWL